MAQDSAKKPTSLFAQEEEILKFWQADQTFAKSLAKNKSGENFSFYDGPPFITGAPHYATLLPSIAKDVIPRYQTMKGKRVRRVWGWDVHGLPAETQVEKKLGLKTKRDIEKLGIDRFIAECRTYVAEVSDAWRWYIDHIGRWVEMDKAYRTDQLSYMESVIWAFKALYDQGLIYQSRRTSLYCPRCATPLSKFEVTMDSDSYREVEDPAVTVGLRLLGDEVYLLAWTTTPWTLPANLALAVDPEAEYVKVTDGQRIYILAHQALERYRDLDLEIVEAFKGQKLVGEHYEPLYPSPKANKDTDYRVYPADFVTMEEGTGIVHVAPGFGEADSLLGIKVGLSLLETLDEEGNFLPDTPWPGRYYKQTDREIVRDLKDRQLLIKEDKITHSYPHCYRCGTPLIYKSQPSWFVKVDSLRDRLLSGNRKINWMPAHFGPGRFAYNIANAPDWSISRTRYWGTPLPVWQTESGETIVVGSLAELEKLSGEKVTDLHRPAIDRITIKTKSGQIARRVPEVLDCWFESGAMPYAQDHYPFANQKLFEAHFPADYIVEYTGQLRGWFYYLHLLSNALKGKNSFKNAVVTGVLMGTDNRKMSKSYGNYPDPRLTIEKYGAEALRLYLMSSKIMDGEDLVINETEIREQARLLTILHHTLRYYLTYADLPQANSKESAANLLDRWIIARLEQFIGRFSQSLDEFDLGTASRAVRPLVEDLSTWYIRGSRERFVAGDRSALQTLKTVLERFAVSVAPLLPFSAEQIYRSLGHQKSVHLADYPQTDFRSLDRKSLALMNEVRELASLAHMIRAGAGISLRQPLAELVIADNRTLKDEPEYQAILAAEVNVGRISFNPVDQRSPWQETKHGKIYLDTSLRAPLILEGRYRELIRQLQEARKQAGLTVGQKASLKYRTSDEQLKKLIRSRNDDLMAKVCLSELEEVADSRLLQPISGESLKVRFKLTKNNS